MFQAMVDQEKQKIESIQQQKVEVLSEKEELVEEKAAVEDEAPIENENPAE